jgi:hypothetical protein
VSGCVPRSALATSPTDSSPRAFRWAARVSPTSKISVRGLHDRIDIGTRQSIADRAGAKDFDAFCEWIDRHR